MMYDEQMSSTFMRAIESEFCSLCGGVDRRDMHDPWQRGVVMAQMWFKAVHRTPFTDLSLKLYSSPLRHARRSANRTQRTTTTMPLAAADLEKVQSLALALRSLSSIAQSSTLAYPRVRPGWPRGAVGTEWKCPWNYGHSQCAMLFLAHGLPLSAESEAAIQWAMQLKQRLKSAILNYSLEHWPSACAHGRRRAEPD